MILRDYLYVDSDKVRGLIGQITDSVPLKRTDSNTKTGTNGMKLKIYDLSSTKSRGTVTEHSLEDNLFKALESDLETLGFLTDISAELKNLSTWDEIESIIQPGTIIRLTCEGAIFHPKQWSEVLSGLATTAQGLRDMEIINLKNINPKDNKDHNQKILDQEVRQRLKNPVYPEDYLPMHEVLPDVPRNLVAGMMRVVRGTFADGLHLLQRPIDANGPVVYSRLEEGRRFLDSTPEVLLNRYGVNSQVWTVVGSVGQIGRETSDGDTKSVMGANGDVNRALLVDLVAEFMQNTGGLVDLPGKSEFTIVPLAVYRTVSPNKEVDIEL